MLLNFLMNWASNVAYVLPIYIETWSCLSWYDLTWYDHDLYFIYLCPCLRLGLLILWSNFYCHFHTVTLSPVEHLTVEYLTFKKFEKAIITVNWDFFQTSKQIYRKHKCKEKLFGEFQCLPCFPRKTVLYSSTKFGI